jgi:hypothetical protein
MAGEGIDSRFAKLQAEADSIGAKVRDIMHAAAKEVAALFGTNGHPAQKTIIQRLEQAAHAAVTSFGSVDQADPTQVGQSPTGPPSTPEGSSTPPTPTGSPGTSSAGSQPTSTGGSTS